jgi:hypothetical protein
MGYTWLALFIVALWAHAEWVSLEDKEQPGEGWWDDEEDDRSG